MSSDDEYTDIKISREMREAMEALVIPLIVKRARMSGFFKSNELKSLYNKGQIAVETGIRDLGHILDRAGPSDLDVTTANEAIKQIIHGSLNLGAFWAVTKSKYGPSDGGKKGRKKSMAAAEKWKKHVRDRTEDLFKENPKWPGTLIRDMIKDEKPRPPGIRLPDNREIYEKSVLPTLRALKKGIK